MLQAPLEPCRLCPRCCGAVRAAGETGFCGAGHEAKLFRWGPHFGEEPPLTGTRGSGTLFFSHCTLACCYCQNYPWSQDHRGDTVSDEALARILAALAERGCHNWNLVTPTPWLPRIRAAARRAKALGAHLPFVYNTSGFERLETAAEYRDLMDVVLTDLRYADPRTAQEASASGDYVARSRAFAEWAWREVGPLELDGGGIARRGMICRLLVLPGHAQEAEANLDWLARRLGTDIHVSLMSQYTPVYRAASRPGWDRPLAREEYERVRDRLDALGFENGWVQEFSEDGAENLLGCAMSAGGASAPPEPLF